MLSPELLESLRQRLLGQLEELHAQLGADDLADRAARDWRGNREVHDPGEVAAVSAVDDVAAGREAQHIRDALHLEAALHRMALGDYGHCIDCNEQIDAARLLFDPATLRCQSCQATFERTPGLRSGNRSAPTY